MTRVNVIVQHRSWEKFIKNPELYLKRRVKILTNKTSFLKKKKYIFTVLLSGNKEIIKLNKKFRKKNKSTDILSFPAHILNKNQITKIKENIIYLGDIIININKVKFNENTLNFNEQFNKLWIHGFLHLFNYQHKKNKDYLEMSRLEKKFLKNIK